MYSQIISSIHRVQFALCVRVRVAWQLATCSVLIQTNIANKHMRMSEPLRTFQFDCFRIITTESCRKKCLNSLRLHFIFPFLFHTLLVCSCSTRRIIRTVSPQPSRAERNVWTVCACILYSLSSFTPYLFVLVLLGESSAQFHHNRVVQKEMFEQFALAFYIPFPLSHPTCLFLFY